MQQLVYPDLNTQGRVGWCLDFARRAFSAPAIEYSAWIAWQNAQYKHTDGLPDVCVPLWFSYWQDGENLGHVVIWVPGRGFLSSPWKQGTGQAWLSSIQQVESYYHCTYVGWSEDISTVRVAQGATGGEEVIQDADNEYGRWRKLFHQIRGRDASREEFRNAAVGRSWLNAMEILSDNEEADQATANGDLGRQARTENWQGQLADLRAKVDGLAKDVQALKQENETLKKKLEECGQVVPPTPETDSITISKDNVWTAFVNFVTNIFKKG